MKLIKTFFTLEWKELISLSAVILIILFTLKTLIGINEDPKPFILTYICSSLLIFYWIHFRFLKDKFQESIFCFPISKYEFSFQTYIYLFIIVLSTALTGLALNIGSSSSMILCFSDALDHSLKTAITAYSLFIFTPLVFRITRMPITSLIISGSIFYLLFLTSFYSFFYVYGQNITEIIIKSFIPSYILIIAIIIRNILSFFNKKIKVKDLWSLLMIPVLSKIFIEFYHSFDVFVKWDLSYSKLYAKNIDFFYLLVTTHTAYTIISIFTIPVAIISIKRAKESIIFKTILLFMILYSVMMVFLVILFSESSPYYILLFAIIPCFIAIKTDIYLSKIK
ncbi:MAG: hypothetical protein JXR48_05360 [Candidatus Delongbacteria bacterium]|nr:hypothetical protein [Candidatus Delongbacteria bacterium]MBN2834377.1 hypothetical protein [Candidatus Delongbacteria bacterium]